MAAADRPVTWQRLVLAPRSVIAYHGCSRETAKRILAGEAFDPSQNAWDWLGSGVYFWEYAPHRAREWAEGRHGADASVLKAAIRLGRCLNLLDTAHMNALHRLYHERIAALTVTGSPLPWNRPDGRHFLDRFIVDDYCGGMLRVERVAFQTVRACLPEGEPIYPGSAILARTHVQLAVRDQSCISSVRLVSW